MKIVLLYSAILTFLFVYLSMRTISLRRRLKISIGHSENAEMLRAIRAHSNFAEYTPLALLLLGFLEFYQTPTLVLHVLGLCLTIGRFLHAFGVSQVHENFKFRVSGMMMTFAYLITTSCILLYYFFSK